MRYAIYFTWKDDNFEDTCNAESARERDGYIDELINRNQFSEISYCKIYANGEYGKRIWIRKQEVQA